MKIQCHNELSWQMYNIDLTVAGSNWNVANAAAEEFIATQPAASTFFVHPFEGETTWEGHATMIQEIRRVARMNAVRFGHI